MNKSALAGVKIIELCQMVAGPFCGKLLADLGAEVIKIEEPGRGDEARARGPFLNYVPDPECSGLFAYLNTNKLGITLNIESTAGRDILREFIQEPDAILIEDKPPKLMAELELTYEDMKRVNSRLIMTSITPFGQTGPYRDFKAYPLNLIHGGGEGYTIPGGTEYLDRPPLKVGRFVGEYDAGLSAAVAMLGALYWRGVSGLGQHIDISKQEAIMSLYHMDIPRYANEGLVISRANQGYPFGGIMPCQDGYVAIVCWTEREWQALVQFMGDPDWAKDERFKDNAARLLHGEEIQAMLLEFTMRHTMDELYHQGQAVGCPIAKLFTIADLFHCKQLAARELFVEVDHPKIGKVKYPSAPYKFSETPWEIKRPAPLLGQHNKEVYCQYLGYSEEKLDRLRQVGVI